MITRFAPSPTGYLHLGHAYAALKAWDAAQDGGFVLRIEDLDRGRSRPQYVQALFDDLAWLGVRWGEPVVFQSARTAAYRQALASLTDRGLTYPCFCTRTGIAAAQGGDRSPAPDIAAAAAAPHLSAQPAPVYPGTCRELPAAERQRRLQRGESHALRLDVGRAIRLPEVQDLHFLEHGENAGSAPAAVPVQPQELGDIVLARKDLPAAYHLAVVVDDAFQGVTLVTRGEDLQPATHVQRLLQGLLGLPAPEYAHHRLVLDAQGRKLSKRDQAQTLRALRAGGYTPAAVREQLGLG